ncbi:MAG: alpha/beta fold hydrolase [Acidobacteriota bacterium]
MPRPDLIRSLHRAAAHWHTIAPTLAGRLAPPAEPAWRPFEVAIDDPLVGSVRVTGRLSEIRSEQLVVLVHGLGGCADSSYMRRASRIVVDAGLACLRLELRGADRTGRDYYHAGLTADLSAALAAPELAGYRRLVVLGVSLGGHLALRWATEPSDPRVQAVAAVSSPLDLEAAVRNFDTPSRWIYRQYVLGALKDTYAEVAARRDVETPVEAVRAVRLLRDYDRLVVVPRFGFGSTGAYYASQSVGSRLHRLAVPALLVASEHDPMVDAESVRAGLRRGGVGLRVAWVRRGGHVGFPPALDLGFDAPPGILHQVLAWLLDPEV